MGDLNDMYQDNKSSVKLRLLYRLFGWMEVREYYDDKKPIQRKVGKRVRLYRMAAGKSMRQFKKAGLSDADPSYRPTHDAGKDSY